MITNDARMVADLGILPAALYIFGHLLNPNLGRLLDDAPHAFDSLAMPFNPRQPASLSPTPIAIHDHGNVPRPLFSVDTRQRGGQGAHMEIAFGGGRICLRHDLLILAGGVRVRQTV